MLMTKQLMHFLHNRNFLRNKSLRNLFNYDNPHYMRFLLYTALFLITNTYGIAKSHSPFDNIDLTLNFQKEILFIKAAYTHHWTTTDTDSIFFLFNTSYPIQKINCEGYISHQVTNKKGDPFSYLLIQIDRNKIKGKSTVFEFDYSIDLKKQNHLSSNWIELSLDKFWYPCYNGLGIRFTSTMHISNIPLDYTLYSYPHALFTYKNNDAITIVNNKPWYDVLLMAGKCMKEWAINDTSLSIKFYAAQYQPDSIITSMHQKVKDIISVYNSSFAAKAPIKNLSILLRNTKREEIGYQFYRPGLVVSGADFDSYGNLAHEIAHHWWLNADILNGQWLNEGFANYSMLLVLDKYDTTKRNNILTSYKKNSNGKGSVVGSTVFAANAYERYYYKPTVILWDLDRKIGRVKMMHLLAERIRVKADTEESVLKLVQQIAGKSIESYFFEQLKEE